MSVPSSIPGSPVVHWFRRDLRLGDNPALAAAAAAGPVLPLVVIDPVVWSWAGGQRRRQYQAHLAALAGAIAAGGGHLIVRRGDPRTVVADLVAETRARAVFANEDVTPLSRRRDDAVRRSLGVPLHSFWGSLVHPPGEVRTARGSLSQVFTPFFRAWTATPRDPWPESRDPVWGDPPATGGETPTGEGLPGEGFPGDGLPGEGFPGEGFPGEGSWQSGGEEAARIRLDHAVAALDEDPEGRDRVDAAGTTRLSADLHFGTLSAREVADRFASSTRGALIVRQLAWRDWWAHLLWYHPRLVDHALTPSYDSLPWVNDAEEFACWAEGRTGYPIIDAAMRELSATGWMHNRLRMVTASFLVKDLLVDWRRGERWFRRLLVDGDVAQNVGNWQWVAGTGPDAAPYFRVFNPVTQARRHDPTGSYVRRWVPEVAELPNRWVHAPWEAPADTLAAAGVTLGHTYPRPLVDHSIARHRALAAYASVRSPS